MKGAYLKEALKRRRGKTKLIHNICNKYENKEEHLITMLQEVQKISGYLSENDIEILSEETLLSESYIYGVATFYTGFRFEKPGKHIIQMCKGTPCHIFGGENFLTRLEYKLGIKRGETTADGLFTLEKTGCVGCCALAPVVRIDKDYFGGKRLDEAMKLIDKIISEASL